MTYDLKKHVYCPVCHQGLDCATGGEERSALPGDVAVCMYCESVCQYTEDMELEELKEVPEELTGVIKESILLIRLYKSFQHHVLDKKAKLN